MATGVFGLCGMIQCVLPFRSGEIVLLVMLRRTGIISSVTELLPRWFLLRVLDVIVLGVLVLISSVLFSLPAALASFGATAGWVALMTIAVLAATLLFASIVSGKATNSRPKGLFSTTLWRVRRGLAAIADRRILVQACVWTCLTWLWMTCAVTSLYLAVPTALTISGAWCATLLVQMILIVPLQAPLGIGTAHAIQVAVLLAFGLDYSCSIALAIAVHGVMVLTITIQGVLGYLLLKLAGKLRRHDLQIGEARA
jgi:hypothetical protein